MAEQRKRESTTDLYLGRVARREGCILVVRWVNSERLHLLKILQKRNIKDLICSI